MWLAIVTMTTVGYGDFFPKSFPAKLIGIVCMFYGVYLTSLFIISVETILEMTEAEAKNYMLIDRVEQKDKIKKTAADVFIASFKLRKKIKQGKNTYLANSKVQLYKEVFSQTTKKFRAEYQVDTPEDQIKRSLKDLRETIEGVQGSIGFIAKHYEVEIDNQSTNPGSSS